MLAVTRCPVWVKALLLFCMFSMETVAAQDGEKQLAKFLDDIGLTRLSLRHQENQYARTTNAEQRVEIAREILKQYRRLMLNPTNREELPRILTKTESLLADFAILDSPQIQLARSHATFLIAENRFFQWWRTGADMANATTLIDQMKTLEKDVMRQQRQLVDLRNDLVAVLPLVQDSNSTEQQNLNKVESRLAHIEFLLGWTRYFQAVMLPDPDPELLNLSHADFYRSLHIEHSSTLDKVDSKWMELDGVFARRSLLGLGLIYAAQSEFASSQFCFDKLKQFSPEFEKDLWQLNAIAFARDWDLLAKLVEQHVLTKISVNEKRQYYKALTFAGIVAESFSEDADSLKLAKQIQRSGFLGMLRGFDFDSINDVTDLHRFEFAKNNAEDIWIQGVVLLHQAESQPDLYKLASETLQKAKNDPNLESPDLARINYLIAISEFADQHADAALAYLNEDVIASKDDRLAESALWLKARILVTRARQSYRHVPKALVALNQLESRFPNSRFTKQIQFEKLLLESKLLKPKQANELLEGVQSDNRFYPDAIAEIANNQFKSWKTASRSLSPDESTAYSKLCQAGVQVIDDSRTSFQQKVASIFYMIDASIHRNVDSDTIDKLFSVFDEIAEDPQNLKPEIKEKHLFYKFRAARHSKEWSAAQNAASWLAENATNQQHRVAALGYLVQQADDRNAPADERVIIYAKLVDELGSDESALQSSRNARVAANRFVDLLIQSSRYQEARRINDRLLSAFPSRQNYVVNAARIATELGTTDSALENWRKVAAGTKAGEQIWVEAKYNIAAIVALEDIDLARQIALQTMSLTNQMPQDWQLKFDGLIKQLDNPNSIQQ